MQVSVEAFGKLGRRLTVAVPADEVERVYHERLRRFSGQVRMPGFRPGKVPLKLVEAQYGGRLMEEAAGELIEKSLRQALGREGLRPVVGPRIQRKAVERGQTLEYTAEFEVYPEIPNLSLQDKSLQLPVATITDEDIDRTVETIRRQRVEWQPRAPGEAAQAGDRVRISLVGRLDGEPFEGGSAENLSVVLGSNNLLSELEQGLIGMRPGERRTIPVAFPADYRHERLAGKTVTFEVSLHEAAQPVLPAVDQDFARALGVADGSLEKLRAEVRANLEREARRRSRAILRARAWRALLEANPIEVPESLLAAEIAREKRMLAVARGGSAPLSSEEEAQLRERARRRVALGLIVNELIRVRGIRPDPARVRERLAEMAAEYESPEAFLRWHYEKPERLAEVESLVMEEQAVEAALADARVEEVSVSFQELLNLEAAV
jgi:trigger factor